MQVIEISKYYPPHTGGIETLAAGISGKLAEKHDVVVLTSNIPKSKYLETSKNHQLNIYRNRCWMKLFNTTFTPKMFLDLLMLDYDVVHIHLPDPFGNVMLILAQMIKKRPVVVTYHADIVRGKWYHKLFMKLYKPFLEKLLRDAFTIIPTTMKYAKTSPFFKEEYIAKSVCIPNFVDIEQYKPKEVELNHRKKILFVGRLVPYKGLATLIRALPYINASVDLDIVGSGPLQKDLESLAKEYSTNTITLTNGTASETTYFIDTKHSITFWGKVDDLSEFYNRCNMIVLPSVSRQEAFGIVLLEAMACGKPCVASDIGGVSEVVGEYGRIVEPYDVKGLTEAIQEVLDSEWNPEKIRERVVDMFSLDHVAKSYEGVLYHASRMGNSK